MRERPPPVPDRDSAEWWERLARREFAVQRCDSCDTPRFPPRAFCPACHREGARWEAVEPVGTVESWIVNHQAFTPGGTPGGAEPYVVVMVRLAAVPRCLVHGNWRGDREPRGGQAVRGVYTPLSDGLMLLDWRPAAR
ncbi:Zn-ribbon domain-containing OB-fold protein [Nonomuraea sp. ZG12]|uniref:Zn-ribbon domain-containing OB-fold protein n=1 Tax=Nonomuraea sp. ZG12 TaxID=3452207 RepID=UPI003F889667